MGNKIILPDEVFGINTKEALKNWLKRDKNAGNGDEQHSRDQSLAGIDKGDYIFMPKYKLYIAKEKSHLGKNWYEAHEALHQEGKRMLTLREFADFLLLLKNGNEEFQRIYNDITEVRAPWRGEWLDADFKVVNGVLYINYNHRIINGNLQPQNSEPLTDYLAYNKTPGISLDDWLLNPTQHGLPRSDIKNGSLYYRAPMKDNKSVAGFGANSGRAGLGCGRDPQGSNASLGVRAAKIKV